MSTSTTSPVIGTSRPHESAQLHVTGRAPYIDDLPEVAGTLHAALGLSPVAHGRLVALDLARVRAMPGVVAVLSAADIPGVNDCGPIVHDDPILAEGTVNWRGQPMFLVVARTRGQARRAAALAAQVATIEPLPAVLDPGIFGTRIHNSIVFRNKINIVKNETTKIISRTIDC